MNDPKMILELLHQLSGAYFEEARYACQQTSPCNVYRWMKEHNAIHSKIQQIERHARFD